MLKIKDFEDYTIDKKGNVFSIRKHKYLKHSINKYGYCKVTLQKNKHKKMFSVHRLVAQAYLKDYSENLQVNHINGIKTDNRLENLEMVTAKENMQKAVSIGLFEKVRKINRENAIKNNLSKYHVLANEALKKKVAKYDKENNLLEIYESISEASRKTGIAITSISYCANGKRKTGGGFIWHFV